MGFTTLNLAPRLDPIFDKCVTDVAAVDPGLGSARGIAKLKSDCMAAAKAEIDRQGGIYTSEEQTYIAKIKRMHQEAKALTFTLVDYAQKLSQAWNDAMFAEMPEKAKYVGVLSQEAHAELAGAVAHQGWRSNQPWTFAKAESALGKEGNAELFALFKTHRDPMIMAAGDLKTFVIKLDEFHKRAIDSLKAAETCKARAKVNMTEFVGEVKTLLQKAIKAKQDVEHEAKAEEAHLQNFIVLCNKQKTKLDEKAVKAADGHQLKSEIWLKNSKTTTKTLEVELGNAQIRAKKSVVPAQVTLVNGVFGEADRNLQDTRKAIAAFAGTLDVHKKKLAEAKTRK